jgi:hypothetical protein
MNENILCSYCQKKPAIEFMDKYYHIKTRQYDFNWIATEMADIELENPIIEIWSCNSGTCLLEFTMQIAGLPRNSVVECILLGVL